MKPRVNVTIDNYVTMAFCNLALKHKENGGHSLLIIPKSAEGTLVRLESFEKEKSLASPLLSGVYLADDLSFETLDLLLKNLESEFEFAAIFCIIGIFSPEGSVGETVARLAEVRGLTNQNPDAVARCNNKFLTRDALESAGVRTVRYALIQSPEDITKHAERVGYPFILKPLTGACSSFIMKCRTEEEGKERFQLAIDEMPQTSLKPLYSYSYEYPLKSGESVFLNPAQMLLMEEYIEGREASVEIIVTEDEVYPLLVHDKLLITEEKTVTFEHLLITPPTRFSEQEVQEMKDYAVAVARALGIKNTFCHVELRYRDSTGPELLEINPRIGGMFVAHSLQTLLNFSTLDWDIELKSGKRLDETIQNKLKLPPTPGIFSMFALYPPKSGLLKEVKNLDLIRALPGMQLVLQAYPNGFQILCDNEEVFLISCWMQGESEEQILSVYEESKKLIEFVIE